MHRRNFLAALAAAPLLAAVRGASAQTPSKIKSVTRDSRGTTLWMGLEHAPSAGTGYRDDTVIVFVPSYYRNYDGEDVAALVHFHGHNTTADRALTGHQLREQLSDSKQNAVLIVPQLAVMAADSSCGHIESNGGLAALVDEAIYVTAHEGRYNLGDSALPRGARPGTGWVSAP